VSQSPKIVGREPHTRTASQAPAARLGSHVSQRLWVAKVAGRDEWGLARQSESSSTAMASRRGSEEPNGIRARPLGRDASTAQRKAYEHAHVTNLETGQCVHKAAALAHVQKQARDATPGAGHQARYVTGERQPIIAEDADGTGFACGKHYQVYLGEDGSPLNGGSTLQLEGPLSVGYVRLLELRKLNGKRRVVRLSVRASHASRCTAVILPLVERDGRWVPDHTQAPLLVPVLTLGRCMVATEGSGDQAGTFAITPAVTAVGGPRLLATYLSADLFRAAAMMAVGQDLMDMKVAELKEELQARDQPRSGNKAWLRRRLHGAIVCAHLETVQGR